MNRFRVCRVVNVAFVLACLGGGSTGGKAQEADLIVGTDPLTPQEQLAKFHLPPGFRIELVAAEPDISKPMNLNFDAAGRLFVSQSVEYPFPAEPGTTPRDAVRMVVDQDGDGVPETFSTFADQLNIPIGLTPVADGLMAFSIPNIYHFKDADHDGRVESRTIAYREFGHGDTHGMSNSYTWWIDGWIYACHGYSNTSTLRGSDGQAITMQSGNTYRFRPDGTHVEQFTWGQVNPFGLAFDPLGNIFTADCHSRPIYMLLRGAYYPSFEKPHDGLGFGPPMIDHSHGSTGIAGIAYYAADQFPEDYRDNIFIGNPVTGRVNRDRLEAHGSSYKAVELPDLVACDDPWFRPVDLQLAPDGSLYIADFYNSIIGHYEVALTDPRRDRERGRIWRVVYEGRDGESHPSPETPDLTRASLPELLTRLGDSNLWIRVQSTHQLVHRVGPPAVAPLLQQLFTELNGLQRVHALWTLERLGALDAENLHRLSTDSDRMVRVHVLKVLANRSHVTDADRRLLLQELKDPDAFVRRAAVEVLGVHPHAEAVEPLMKVWRDAAAADTHLIHAARVALRNTVRNLDLLPDLARQYHDSADSLKRLADVSLSIQSPSTAEFLMRNARQIMPADDRLGDMAGHMVRHLPSEQLPELYSLLEEYQHKSIPEQLSVLRGVRHATLERGVPLPDGIQTWSGRLAQSMSNTTDEQSIRKMIRLIRDFQLVGATEQLVTLTQMEAQFPELRLEAMDALADLGTDRAVEVLVRIVADSQEDLILRQDVARAIGRINTDASRAALLQQLQVAPQEMSLSVGRGMSRTREGAAILLQSIERGIASPRLLQDVVVTRELRAARLARLESRMNELLEGLPPESKRILELISDRRTGYSIAEHNPQRGAELFVRVCSACHRLADKGNKVGPALDGVGFRGLDRLLEDVLDPNRNIDANFRATVVVLKDGRIATGLLLRQDGQILLLVDEKGREQRIPVAQVEEYRQFKLSPMPSNVVEMMNEQDFYDLIAFLLSQRQESASDSK